MIKINISRLFEQSNSSFISDIAESDSHIKNEMINHLFVSSTTKIVEYYQSHIKKLGYLERAILFLSKNMYCYFYRDKAYLMSAYFINHLSSATFKKLLENDRDLSVQPGEQATISTLRDSIRTLLLKQKELTIPLDVEQIESQEVRYIENLKRQQTISYYNEHIQPICLVAPDLNDFNHLTASGLIRIIIQIIEQNEKLKTIKEALSTKDIPNEKIDVFIQRVASQLKSGSLTDEKLLEEKEVFIAHHHKARQLNQLSQDIAYLENQHTLLQQKSKNLTSDIRNLVSDLKEKQDQKETILRAQLTKEINQLNLLKSKLIKILENSASRKRLQWNSKDFRDFLWKMNASTGQQEKLDQPSQKLENEKQLLLITIYHLIEKIETKRQFNLKEPLVFIKGWLVVFQGQKTDNNQAEIQELISHQSQLSQLQEELSSTQNALNLISVELEQKRAQQAALSDLPSEIANSTSVQEIELAIEEAESITESTLSSQPLKIKFEQLLNIGSSIPFQDLEAFEDIYHPQAHPICEPKAYFQSIIKKDQNYTLYLAGLKLLSYLCGMNPASANQLYQKWQTSLDSIGKEWTNSKEKQTDSSIDIDSLISVPLGVEDFYCQLESSRLYLLLICRLNMTLKDSLQALAKLEIPSSFEPNFAQIQQSGQEALERYLNKSSEAVDFDLYFNNHPTLKKWPIQIKALFLLLLCRSAYYHETLKENSYQRTKELKNLEHTAKFLNKGMVKKLIRAASLSSFLTKKAASKLLGIAKGWMTASNEEKRLENRLNYIYKYKDQYKEETKVRYEKALNWAKQPARKAFDNVNTSFLNDITTQLIDQFVVKLLQSNHFDIQEIIKQISSYKNKIDATIHYIQALDENEESAVEAKKIEFEKQEANFTLSIFKIIKSVSSAFNEKPTSQPFIQLLDQVVEKFKSEEPVPVHEKNFLEQLSSYLSEIQL